MKRYSPFLKEAYYHLIEVKPHSNVIAYKIWALRRLLKIAITQTANLERFLPRFDAYITNRYGTFFLPKNSDFVFTMSSFVESNLLEFFDLPPEGTFLDIGANAGKYSIILAKKRPKARIFSFEPSPYTINVLRKNVTANKLSEQIKVLNIGLSDKVGELLFAYSPTFTGVSHVMETSTGQYDRFKYDHVSVNVDTVDGIVIKEGISSESIYLIKVDVEGHELSVLNGAFKTLATMPSGAKIIIEIHPDRERINYIMDTLHSFGFIDKQIDEENYVFTKQ